MEKRIITVLTLKEDERLKARKAYTCYFRKTSDFSVYLMDPVIVLGEKSDIRRHITLSISFHPDKDLGVNDYGTYYCIKEKSEIAKIQAELGLKAMDTGLHLSMKDEIISFPLPLERIRIDSIALAEVGENTFRIFMRKKLSTGR